ncbi:hypothetical protein AgCh_004941 [Apium graveolens]
MYHDLKENFWWPNMKKEIAEWVSKCYTCQRVKAEHQHPSGLLQLLDIPEWKWEHLAMDFMVRLPRTKANHDAIWNNNYHASIGMPPYEALYGRKCRSPVHWDEVGERKILGPELIQQIKEKIELIRKRLDAAQNRQRKYADQARKDIDYQEGEHVLLKISPWKGLTRFGNKGKLKPRYVGPFEILKKVGKVVYELALPPHMQHIHNVFHVSMLKRYNLDSRHVIEYEPIDIQPDLSFIEQPMADKRMTRLAKMNVARKSNDFPIRSRYTSLIDMINTRGDEYPSDAHLDAHDHISALRDPKELEKLSSCFKIKEPFKLVLAGPADRACQWKKDALCVYRDTLRAGIRLPFHPFIPLLLADVGISPCQLPPNSWRLILCYLSQCAKHNVPTSVAVFRKIFQFKNSPDKSPGWVSINQRPTIPHIVNGKSIPDNNLGWKKDFLFVIWEGGDWGSLFRSSFGLAVDGSPNDITLSEEEARGFNLLTQDNGTSHCWDLIRETVLVERDLSPVNKKMVEKIEEATKPKDLETTRMKRAGKIFKDPRLGDRFPEFLLQATEPDEEGPSQVLRTKQRPGAYFQPAWGIRGKDSIVGSTALSKEWSKHSISPVDYQDFVLQQDLEGNELFGAQALATANAHFQGAIHQAKAWKVGLEDANKKLEEANQKIEALEAQLASSTSDLETARAENVILKAQKEKAFDGWMDTQEFKDLMVEHDALLHPVSYKEGWDAAVEAIQDEFPEVLEQSPFPCPVRVLELGGVTEKLAGMIKDGEEEDSSEEEFEPVAKKARVEESPKAVPQQPSSPAEGTSTGTSEGTTETSEETTETSEETSDSGSEESQPSKA